MQYIAYIGAFFGGKWFLSSFVSEMELYYTVDVGKMLKEYSRTSN